MTVSKSLIHFTALASLTIALPAAAQPSAAAPAPVQPSVQSAAQAGAPAAAPMAPAAAATPPAVPPPANDAAPAPLCRLGNHAGVAEDDASTAASLVCREVEARKPAGAHHYRVDLDRLGTVYYLALIDEDASGNAASRRMKLNNIEDVGETAPRLADALLTNKSVSETQRTDNLVTSETRAPIRKSGTLQVGVGVMGMYAPGVPTLAPGFELSLRYDTPSWVAHSTLRYAAHMDSNEGLRVFDWGVGARYMLGQEDVSPFVGGGLAYMAIQRDGGSQNGIGAFGEVGVEMLRLHKNRLGAALRADAPLFAVEKKYVLPLSLAVTFTFD